MRKHFLILFLALIVVNTIHSQTRGTKVGYIDMEYILQNVPNYTEATVQLEQKAQKWKQEIETKKIEINKIKEALAAEKPLLTKGLIEERELEIKFLENEMLDFQQKRFGANGDLILQKSVLVKPIQDQVFTAVQDIAEAKRYDFIFDKSSDLTMLFAAKRFDISDQVLRVLNRAEKREELTKKQIAAETAKESREDAIADNPLLSERQKILDDKKAARDSIVADRKLVQEKKKAEFEERRQKMLSDKEDKKNGTVSAPTIKGDSKESTSNAEEAKSTADVTKQEQIDVRAKTIEDRKKMMEDRKKALEDRRTKILQQRDSIKKAREEQLKLKQ
ncbi:OmpH family outer membrane protein [Flavobacterium sp. ACAM 123]|jgi:Skp family chaperone for outer membrane proteins|uniref:OmpH family outer membrane protein n=1 Tax=Flavobacterium sp. ACAM 123 TaxID=1189620 RepID=UPI0002EE072F|nr:OmpH family outer membrane protein [Flavobacterium sp. ACAM 123]